CEFDHADIYQDLLHIKKEFEKFLRLIPKNGQIIACIDDPTVRDILKANNFKAETYGVGVESHWHASEFSDTGNGIFVKIRKGADCVASGFLPLVGRHNVLNAVAAVAAVEKVGVLPQVAIDSLMSFKGVARRQQISNLNSNIMLVDDFAHHPSEVRETLMGFRLRFPNRRLIAVFEPRTNTSRRSIFQGKYVDSFMPANVIALRDPPEPWKAPPNDLFSSSQLARDLTERGKIARAFPDASSIIDFLISCIRSEDVVIVMSNGGFENLTLRLLTKVEDFEK
ncbi:MAG: glutamate ligase domain-containing protein, partial [Desulfomonilaceae bacterium]